MITFKLYCLITLIGTFYYLLKLYFQEKQFYVFTIYVSKSKFYYFLIINFMIMVMSCFAKITLKLLYGEIRLSELSQVIEKVKLKFIQIVFLFFMLRPNLDFGIMILIILFSYIGFITSIGFKRSSYIASTNEKSKFIQIKIIASFIILGIMNYVLYDKYYISIDELEKNKNNPNLIVYYIFSSEFLILYIRLVAKFYKLSVNLTSINKGIMWEYRPLVFSLISTIKYFIKLIFEIKYCYIIFVLGKINAYYIIDILKGIWKLLKLLIKIYDNYNSSNYINNLVDYKSITIFENIIKNYPNITVEENEKIKNELSVICNICLYEIENGKYLSCGHIFHIKCIKEWIMVNSNCPICKSPIIKENGINSKFYNQQLGINNNNHQMTNEEILQNLNLEKKSRENTFIPKKDSDFEKYNYYRKIQNLLDKKYKKNNNNNEQKEVNPGAISFSLPCEAVLNRGIKNELKRIKIEIQNKKIINLYENPINTISNYKEKSD